MAYKDNLYTGGIDYYESSLETLGKLLVLAKDALSLNHDNGRKRYENRFKTYLGSWVGRIWWWIEYREEGQKVHPPP